MTMVQATSPQRAESVCSADTAVATVLLISDVTAWGEAISSALGSEGFRVVSEATGSLAFEDQALVDVHVALVDLRLRALSGLAVCAAIRARGPVPLMAFGSEGDEMAVLHAFAAGADQYVAVDVSARQLVARLRALLRRFPVQTERMVEPAPALVEIDPVTGVVVTAGVAVKLSRQELEVFQALVARPGRVVTRQELMGLRSGLAGSRRLDFVIRRLREKLEPVEGRRRISVVRGVGFRFDPDGSHSDEPPTMAALQ